MPKFETKEHIYDEMRACRKLYAALGGIELYRFAGRWDPLDFVGRRIGSDEPLLIGEFKHRNMPKWGFWRGRDGYLRKLSGCAASVVKRDALMEYDGKAEHLLFMVESNDLRVHVVDAKQTLHLPKTNRISRTVQTRHNAPNDIEAMVDVPFPLFKEMQGDAVLAASWTNPEMFYDDFVEGGIDYAVETFQRKMAEAAPVL